MEKTELEAICQEILALEGVNFAMFYNSNGEIVLIKSNVEPEHWLMPKDEIGRRTVTWAEMMCEIASELSKYIGKLEAIAFLYEKRNSLIIPENELFLVISTKKTVSVPLIEKVKKIIKKHTR